MMIGTREPFTYRKCQACGSLSLFDRPDDMARFYPEDGYYSLDASAVARFDRPAGRAAAHAIWSMTTNATARPSRRILERGPIRQLVGAFDVLRPLRVVGLPLAGARVLDVGSGAGVSTAMLGALGCDVTGIDPFGPTWERPNARQIRASLDDIEGTWDIIMFHHSLEHIPDARAAIARATQLLSYDGAVIIRIPTCDSVAFREFGAHWIDLDPPRHFFIPSRSGLTKMCADAGLALLATYDDARDIQFWGSELYRRDRPLGTSGSPDALVREVFTRDERAAYRKRTQKMNAAREGDLIACVYRRDHASNSAINPPPMGQDAS